MWMHVYTRINFQDLFRLNAADQAQQRQIYKYKRKFKRKYKRKYELKYERDVNAGCAYCSHL